MIDFIKIQVKNNDAIDRIWECDKLTFHDYKARLNHFDYETMITKETKQYHGIMFCRFETKLEILIRPHYLFNQNIHNANDFSITDCLQTLNSILVDLEIDCTEYLNIVNIEFGVNMLVPGYGKNLVQFTEYWKKTLFKYDSELSYSKKSYLTKPSGRANTFKIVKLYSKGIQHPKFCDKNTIRFEIKSKQYAYIKKLGISSYHDLLNVEVYNKMKDELIDAAKHLLILDQTEKPKNLNIREAKNLEKYLNPHSWYELSIAKGNGFWEQKKRFLKLLDKNGSNIHTIFTQELTKKINSLLDGKDIETCMNSSPSKSSFKKRDMYEFDNSICRISPFPILPISKCQVTSIGLEKEGPFANANEIPKYIRTKTIKYIRDQDPGLYASLIGKYIPKGAERPKYEKSEIQHLAKQIRNRYYNSKRKSYGKKQQTTIIN